MNTNKIERDPFKKRQFKTYFQLSMIAVCFVLVFALLYACTGKTEKVDYSDAKVIQMDQPKDDAPVVVFETSMGTFKAVLYPDEAPNYYEYFTKLVNDGYYEGTYVNMVQNDVFFMGGTKTETGDANSETDTTQIEAEKSKNMWPLKGSLAAYTDQTGFLFWKKSVSTSYLLFINEYKLTDEENSQLDEVTDINPEVPDAYRKYGGVINFAQQYTVFGQVYDGMDIYETICTQDVTDSETLKPAKAITFDKVYMSTYGENKNDEFFTDANSKADESSVSTSDTDSELS